MQLFIIYMIVSISVVTSKDSCPRNDELINCIQHQLRPIEDNGVKCNCNNKGISNYMYLMLIKSDVWHRVYVNVTISKRQK